MNTETGRLSHFPVSFFSIVMGMAGLAIAWGKAAEVFGVNPNVHHGLSFVTLAIFIVLIGLYTAKIVRFPEMVRAELNHPVKLSFVPTISIGLILLAICFVNLLPALSRGMWLVGAVLQLLLTLFVVGRWINHDKFEVHHINPAWFIPAVGNILLPIVGVKYAGVETAWFFFSIGIVFWLVLMTMVYYRMFFHNPLPDMLAPTMFILIAPPAVGFVSYMKITSSFDPFAHVLYYSAFFLVLLLLTMLTKFARLKFFLSWWAYSFPMAAFTIATLVMYQQTGNAMFQWLAGGLLAVTSVLIAGLVVRTIIAISRHGICLPE